MNETVIKRTGINADFIKYIAITAMVIDHIALCFVDPKSILGLIMHIIGRITAPVMAYFLVEGFYHTRNLNKYILRLAIFNLISWIPFSFMTSGHLLPIFLNEEGHWCITAWQSVMYTLLMALLALKAVHSEKLDIASKIFCVLGLCIIALAGDWSFLPICWALIMDRYRNDFKKLGIVFSVFSITMTSLSLLISENGVWDCYQFGVILALIPLYFYNGSKGSHNKFNKWFFYVFYPLHMLVLAVFKYVIL